MTLLLVLRLLSCIPMAAGEETPVPSVAEDDDLLAPVKKIKAADKQIASPATPPAAKEELKREREGEVKKIEAVGDRKPADHKAQREVTKALSSVGENDRAMPFADRGVALAEAQGNPRLLGESLALRAQVQQKRGNVEEAYADSSRACETDPSNTRACQLALLTRGRSNSSAGRVPGNAAQADGARAPGNSGERSGGTSSPAASAGPGSLASGAVSAPGPATLDAGSLRSASLIEEARAKLKLDPAAGMRLLERAVEAAPRSAKARVARSQARRSGGDAAGALEDAEAAVRLDPKNAPAWAARGEAKAVLGKPLAEVAADLAAARELDPKFSSLYEDALAGLGNNPGETAASGDSAAGVPGARAKNGGAPFRVWGTIIGLGILIVGVFLWLMIRPKRSPPPEAG